MKLIRVRLGRSRLAQHVLPEDAVTAEQLVQCLAYAFRVGDC